MLNAAAAAAVISPFVLCRQRRRRGPLARPPQGTTEKLPPDIFIPHVSSLLFTQIITHPPFTRSPSLLSHTHHTDTRLTSSSPSSPSSPSFPSWPSSPSSSSSSRSSSSSYYCYVSSS